MRKLHIGGKIPAAGWEILNAQAGPNVDHVGDARDLSRFQDGTFDRVYASHVLEHLDYKDEIPAALREWRRVLVPGGEVMISVPDLDLLAGMLRDRESLSLDERFRVMRLMFGGHVDEYDYHQVGLNEDILAAFLQKAGFEGMRRVERFGLFDDASEMTFRGVRISLNMAAARPQARAG